MDKFNSVQLNNAFAEFSSILENHKLTLDQVSEDIKALELKIGEFNLTGDHLYSAFSSYSSGNERLEHRYFLLWNNSTKRLMLSCKSYVAYYDADEAACLSDEDPRYDGAYFFDQNTEKEISVKPLIEHSIYIRVSAYHKLPGFLRDLGDKYDVKS